MKYRADIDGLRAVAVVGVVLFHAYPALLSGGFIGVDVFFVISGYLISALLFKSLKTGKFSVLDFYRRRALRIFPGLSLILFGILIFGWFGALPEAYSLIGDEIASGAAFVANFNYLARGGYFDTEALAKPLLHLWSLGIEEQFYIFFPLALLLIVRSRLKRTWLLSVLAILSFAANVWIVHGSVTKAFYLPTTRIWELMIGSILASVEEDRDGRRFAFPRLLSGCCLLALISSMIFFREDFFFPGWWAVLPTALSFVIIGSETSALANRFLSWKPFVFIGLISYPLYLWHWPLLSIVHLQFHETQLIGKLVAIAVAFVGAYGTYRFLEGRVRRAVHATRVAWIFTAILFSVGAAGRIVSVQRGFPSRLPEEVRPFAQQIDFGWTKNVRAGLCHLQEPNDSHHSESCIEIQRPLIGLWGDSHASSLAQGLRDLQPKMRFGLSQLTTSACPPIFKVPNPIFRPNCDSINQTVFDRFKTMKPDVLILDAAWLHYDYPMRPEELKNRLAQTVREIRSQLPSTRIILIGPAPRWDEPLNEVLYQIWRESHQIPDRTSLHLDLSPAAAETVVREVARTENIKFVSVIDLLCDAAGCITRLGPKPTDLTSADFWHLSRAGADFVVNRMAEDLPRGAPL